MYLRICDMSNEWVFCLIYQDGAKCLCIITDEGHGYRSLQRLQYPDSMASWYWFGRQSKPLNSSFFSTYHHASRLWDMQQKVNTMHCYIDNVVDGLSAEYFLVLGSVLFLHLSNYLSAGNIVQFLVQPYILYQWRSYYSPNFMVSITLLFDWRLLNVVLCVCRFADKGGRRKACPSVYEESVVRAWSNCPRLREGTLARIPSAAGGSFRLPCSPGIHPVLIHPILNDLFIT